MDAREFWKIVEHECARVGSMCIRGCKFHAYYDNHEFCLVKPNTSHKDPVSIAEEIKVKREKPQLPKKTLIIYDSTWPDEVEIHFEHLNDRVNAIIDYLKARENND